MKESREDYLETIFTLTKLNPNVRAIDVANKLNFSRPSVSRALKLLVVEGQITISSGIISFTTKGLQHTKSMLARHENIKNFLVNLGVEPQIADKDACRIEHVLSEQSLFAMVNALNNLNKQR